MSFSRASVLAVLLPLAAGAALATEAREASASVSIAILFDDLVREASTVDVVTPVEQHAVWENGRIYTYTRVHVDRSVAGDLSDGGETWVRTLGGVVGKVGQVVDGEPVLTVGRPSMLFLQAGPAGTHEVTARAQGQFAVVTDTAKHLKIVRSAAVGALVTATKPMRAFVPSTAQRQAMSVRAPYASDALHERSIDDAVLEVATAWKRLHAPK